MEQAAQVGETACLVRQFGKMINFFREKIFDHIRPTQLVSLSPVSTLSRLAYFHIIAIRQISPSNEVQCCFRLAHI